MLSQKGKTVSGIYLERYIQQMKMRPYIKNGK